MLILSHPKGAPLVKSFRFENKIYNAVPLEFPILFNFYEASINNLEGLSILLSELENEPDRMVVRGAPVAHASDKQISRKVVGSNAGIADSPRQWLCIDIDDLSSPVNINLSTKGLLHLARFTAEQLPEEFKATDFHYQFSSSMGIKAGIRLHLWYWLSRPISNEEAKAWLSRSKTQVDVSLYRPSQPHFTAAPIFDPPEADPLEKRSGLHCYESGINEVAVPSDLEELVRIEKNNRRTKAKIVTDGIIDDTIVIRDSQSGLVTDGRDTFLYQKSVEATKELCKGKNLPKDIPRTQQIADLTWQMFCNEADNSDRKWNENNAYEKALYRSRDLEDGWAPNARDITISIVPDVEPYFRFTSVDKKEGEAQLIRYLDEFFKLQSEDKNSQHSVALRATMGSGKTTKTIEKLKTAFEKNPNLKVEMYLPRHNLIREILPKLSELPDYVDVMHVRGRTETSEGQEPVCQRADYVQSLMDGGISVRPNACYRNEDQKCEFYDDCKYWQQFRLNKDKPASLRLLPHEYLGIQRVDTLPTPDIVIIDEAFLTSVHKEINIPAEDIRSAFRELGAQQIGDCIVDSLVSSEPTLSALRALNVNCQIIQDLDFRYLQKESPFDSSSKSAKGKFSASSYKFNAFQALQTLITKELGLENRDHLTRVRFNQRRGTVVINYLSLPKFEKPPSFLILDATADEQLLNRLLGSITFHRIDIDQKAKVIQVYDKTGSNSSWNEREENVDELIEILKEHAQLGKKVLCVSHKLLADELRGKVTDNSIQFAHFQALRGVDQFKDFDTIFVTGRNQPPQTAVDGIARAVWWDDEKEIATDEAANFDAPSDVHLPVEPRGYLLTDPDKNYGVNVRSFSDQRVECIHQQLREAETIQAIARLRLIHSDSVKTVYLLGNLPIEMPIDNLISWSNLRPNGAEVEFMKRGNIPLSAMGWLKMRPDLVQNAELAKKKVQRWGLSKERQFLNFSPIFLRLASVVMQFRQVINGSPKGYTYEHLFRVTQLDVDEHGITTGNLPVDKWIELLCNGYKDIEGSGWGEIQCTGIRWLEAPDQLAFTND